MALETPLLTLVPEVTSTTVYVEQNSMVRVYVAISQLMDRENFVSVTVIQKPKSSTAQQEDPNFCLATDITVPDGRAPTRCLRVYRSTLPGIV